MRDRTPGPASPREQGRFPSGAVDYLLVLGFAAWHIYATWGDVALYYGDYGTWLHGVERFAGGETPYVDFYWMYPPLSLWLVGGIARLAGLALPVIWTITSTIFIGICVAFAMYVGRVVPRRWARATFFAGILLATAYAPVGSAPLPTGMYTPAAPLAGLVLLLAAAFALAALEGGGGRAAAAVGLMAGLAVFTKQDVWLPALFLLGVTAWLAPRRGDRPAVLPAVAAFASVCAVGIVLVGTTIGWDHLLRPFWSPGVMDAVGGRGQFSWERFTVQAAVASGWIAVVATLVWAFDRERSPALRIAVGAAGVALLAAGAHVTGSAVSGMRLGVESPAFPTETQAFVTSAGVEALPVLKRSVVFTSERILHHLLPTILPVLAGIAVLAKPDALPAGTRRTVLVLIGLAVTARARRGFEGVDWYHFLLEIPIYALLLHAYAPLRLPRRACRPLFVLVVAVGLYANWNHGSGPLTSRGSQLSVPVTSARGTFLGNEPMQRQLSWLRSTLAAEDPTGSLPLLVFGQNGGLSYWVDRRNPTPWLLGAELGFWDPERVLEPLYPPGADLFFLDGALYRGVTRPRLGLHLLAWDLPREPSRFARDRERFDPFREGCPVVSTVGNPENPFFLLHRCSDE